MLTAIIGAYFVMGSYTGLCHKDFHVAEEQAPEQQLVA